MFDELYETFPRKNFYGVLQNVLMKFETCFEAKEQHFELLLLFEVRIINIITLFVIINTCSLLWDVF